MQTFLFWNIKMHCICDMHVIKDGLIDYKNAYNAALHGLFYLALKRNKFSHQFGTCRKHSQLWILGADLKLMRVS